MAGLGRIQQRFNAAVVGVLAMLVGFARQEGAEKEAAAGHGHPIHAKYLRGNPYNHNRPGRVYQGYCDGLRYNASGNGKLGRHQ